MGAVVAFCPGVALRGFPEAPWGYLCWPLGVSLSAFSGAQVDVELA